MTHRNNLSLVMQGEKQTEEGGERERAVERERERERAVERGVRGVERELLSGPTLP